MDNSVLVPIPGLKNFLRFSYVSSLTDAPSSNRFDSSSRYPQRNTCLLMFETGRFLFTEYSDCTQNLDDLLIFPLNGSDFLVGSIYFQNNRARACVFSPFVTCNLQCSISTLVSNNTVGLRHRAFGAVYVLLSSSRSRMQSSGLSKFSKST